VKLHKRIIGLVHDGSVTVTVNRGQDAAAVLDAENKLIAYARKGWQEVTNVCDVAWDWVRKDFRFVLKKRS
jgi:hypothetical protein